MSKKKQTTGVSIDRHGNVINTTDLKDGIVHSNDVVELEAEFKVEEGVGMSYHKWSEGEPAAIVKPRKVEIKIPNPYDKVNGISAKISDRESSITKLKKALAELVANKKSVAAASRVLGLTKDQENETNDKYIASILSTDQDIKRLVELNKVDKARVKKMCKLLDQLDMI